MAEIKNPSASDYPKPAVAWAMVILLLVIYTFSFIDRQIIALMGSQIKAYFADPFTGEETLSDGTFGMLGGMAFGVFYAAFGLLCARIADFGNRKMLISAGVFLWSLATAMSGFAKNFIHLFLYRIGVGVGEATLAPGANSLLADSFPRAKLATAMSVYSMGIPMGSALAFIAGGQVIGWVDGMDPLGWALIDDLAGWQKVFLIVGLPGILLAGLVLLMPEPVRKGPLSDVRPPISDTVKAVQRHGRAYTGMIIGISFNAAVGFGSLFWLPQFFERAYAVNAADMGLYFGLLALVTGPVGLLLGGYLADRWYSQNKKDAHIMAACVAPLVYFIPTLVLPFMSEQWLAWAIVAVTNTFLNLPSGIAFSGLNIITPNRMRGQIIAAYVLCTTIIGYGGGIYFIGFMSDIYGGGEWGLRYALFTIAAIAGPISIGLYFWARKAWAAAVTEMEQAADAAAAKN